MQLQDPLAAVTPTLDGAVLQVLAGAHAPFTVANIHALRPDASLSGIRRTLARLVEQGVVIEQRFDRAVAFSFNHNHLAAEGILALARMRDTFIHRLRHTIRGWEQEPILAALFGSAARGEMRSDSDIDILVVSNQKVRPDATESDGSESPESQWVTQVATLDDLVSDWTGNPCQIVEMSHDEFRGKVQADDPLLRNVYDDGIMLFGDRHLMRG